MHDHNMNALGRITALLLLSISLVQAQTYQEDLSQMGTRKTFRAIGDLGDVEQIIDLRGFLPLSCPMKDAYKHPQETSGLMFDEFRWFKYPLVQGLQEVYYGKAAAAEKNFAATPVITEDKLEGDLKAWAQFSYQLSANNGEILFKQLGGTTGFERAEPVAILVTKASVFLLMNFRYGNTRRHDTGQVLAAYEFSRSLKANKMFYSLYTTFAFEKFDKKAVATATPMLTKLALAYFGVPTP